MPDYQKMYYILFNGITNITEQLQTAQIKTEELYINLAESTLKMIKEIEPDDGKKNTSSTDTPVDDHKNSNKA